MIGSHNTFTYLKPKHFIFRLFSHYWKCQELDIKQQYDLGVRYFDIRVTRKDDRWVLCHGIVDLDKEFTSLSQICLYIVLNFPGARFRLILERGDTYLFLQELEWIKNVPQLDCAINKKPWIVLYSSKDQSNITEYSFEDWNWKNLFKCIFKNMIKSKQKISREDALADKDTVHLMDYV